MSEYYDHNSNSTYEIWFQFMRYYINKTHPEISERDYDVCMRTDDDKFITYPEDSTCFENIVLNIMRKEKTNVANAANEFISGIISKTVRVDKYNHIIGLIIKVAELNQDTCDFPKGLFYGFPSNLKKLACDLITEEKNVYKVMNWKSNSTRSRALNRELLLFS